MEEVLHWSIRLCRISGLAGYLIRRINLFAKVAGHLGPARSLRAAELKAFTGPYDSWENRLAILRFIQDIPLEPEHPSYPLLEWTSEHLHTLDRKPMLICWGEKDFVFSATFLTEWLKRFPQARVHRYARAGHYVLEDAAEEILPVIKGFLGNSR